MDGDQVVEEQVHKKGRHRKKQLYNSLLQQMEFYFSDSNLPKDKFLLPLVEQNEYVDLEIFLKFNKIRKLTTNTEDIVKALKRSELLEISEDKSKVKRVTPIVLKENIDDCTIYVERIQPDTTHDWLTSVFSEFGHVVYISIPKYKQNKMNKGFAFVEFENAADAKNALEHFDKIGNKMPSQMAPEDLCSITTYEGEEKDSDVQKRNGEADGEMKTDDTQKKRKRSVENDVDSKKLKKDGETNGSGAGEGEESEEKKKKKNKKKYKFNFKELGLQILSKQDWKKMRNKYLNNQREKMSQLKQCLYKKKYSNRLDDNNKPKNCPYPSEDSKEIPDTTENHERTKTDFIPGVIVKVKLPEGCFEPKKAKAELKILSTDILYVDIQNVGGEDIFLRFSNADSANKFCSSDFNGEANILDGKEELDYWEKIKSDRTKKFEKQPKKQRGRSKLLKKAEKELGKHIKFDDSD